MVNGVHRPIRVVLLTCPDPIQTALANKLAEKVDVAAIVFSRNVPKKRPSPGKLLRSRLNSVAGRIVGRPFVEAWFGIQDRYRTQFTGLPTNDVQEVVNVNDPATVAAIERHAPDLVVVSGTNLVGRRVIQTAMATGAIVNLHTGISPYVKGGPNCTNWCLARGWFHLIGNTVMWLDTGIDTGDLIATEQTILDGTESLIDLHWKVMEHAQDLYVRSISHIANGKPVEKVSQKSIAEGTMLSSSEWGASQMRMALRNFETGYKGFFADQRAVTDAAKQIRLVDLDGQ